ncbi:MAG: tyrosine-type recombinase/integrase [Phycisphaerales bacterium]
MLETRIFEYGGHYLVLRPDSPNIYIYWCRPGSRRVRRRSTGTPDPETAKRRLIAFVDQRNRVMAAAHSFPPDASGGYVQPQSSRSPALLDVLSSHVERLKQEQRPSFGTAKTVLKHWVVFCAKEDIVWVSEATLPMQERFIAWRREKLGHGLGANGTINRDLSILKAALRDAWKRGEIPAPPYINSLPNPPPRERFLTAIEARRLLAACSEPYVRRFVLLALHTLQRPKAIFGLRTSQIDLDRGRIDFRPAGQAASNKRYPVVPITATLRAELDVAIAESRSGYVLEKDGRPLKSMRKAFAAAAQRAGLHGCTPYVLRHTGATLAAAAGVSIRQISGMLGHSSQKITETVYAKHQPEFLREMASTLDGLFGGGDGDHGAIPKHDPASVRAKCAPTTRFHGRARRNDPGREPRAPAAWRLERAKGFEPSTLTLARSSRKPREVATGGLGPQEAASGRPSPDQRSQSGNGNTAEDHRSNVRRNAIKA